jgi:hypothetical protein
MKDIRANSLGTYYPYYRAHALLSQNKDKEIGRIFCEFKLLLSLTRLYIHSV